MIVIRIQHHEVPFLAHFNTADAVRTVQGGGTVQENVHSDGDINKQVGNMG